MSSLVIKNFPPELHHRLKQQAARHHRSMTGEAVALLEAALTRGEGLREAPPPYQGAFPLTAQYIDNAKREGRS